nr:hypothetical protein L203_01013 [Cryptococcus depauperatus CBS 7841]
MEYDSSASRQPYLNGPGSRAILGGDPGPSTVAQMEYETKEVPAIRRVGGKANVSSACAPCKKAHLACDVARPCKRCVNMGKEDQCADVPHKKRGRPKVPRPALGEPYVRMRPAPDASGVGKWRGPSVYDQPYVTAVDVPLGERVSPLRASRLEGSYPDAFVQPFTLFTTTDFKILRATPTCFHLIGYHPNEFVNLNLLDWIHPQDRHLVDMERSRLLSVPYVDAPLTSTEVTQAAVTQRTELELLSPAEGMREPYPNKNVRVLHADALFSPFNVRLHIGGGLGASLWQFPSLNKVYLVVSFLAIPRAANPEDTASFRRASQPAPPTPITPAPISGPGTLPGFSSIAAGVEPPQSLYDRSSGQALYPQASARPLSAHQTYPPASAQSYLPPTSQPYYPRTGPPAYSRRTPSPNPGYRTPQSAAYPAANSQDYPVQPGYYPSPSTGHAQETFRRYEWKAPSGPRDSGPPSGGVMSDGTKRAWEL